ncbi:hypothetical protein RhiirC2_858516 [Rhizophagus irregularis]|uniref:Uncharacterized protein n=1 Tax=Rhizophagus irregularis TaxID=588596 RepID=A0A2N1M4V7_9GLOM|nr:hypothetical protein RhiirC2_858516 [Rhizophagus irregularis]
MVYIPAFWIGWYQCPLLWIDKYQRPLLWIVSALLLWIDIGAFTLDWYRRLSLWIGKYRRLSLWIGISETLHIGETLHFGSISVRSFTLDLVSIGCDLWKPVVSIGIGWNLLDRCQLGPLEIKPVVNFEKLH